MAYRSVSEKTPVSPEKSRPYRRTGDPVERSESIFPTIPETTPEQKEAAANYLKRRHRQGTLPEVLDMEGDNLELFLDMLGLTPRKMRSTYREQVLLR